MKVSDLMIGDWIESNNGNLRQVDINFLNCSDAYIERYYHPIVITPELLKELGCEEKQYDKVVRSTFYEIGKCEYGYKIFIQDQTLGIVNTKNDYYYIADCLYLHTLQHLMKELGIKKEIQIEKKEVETFKLV